MTEVKISYAELFWNRWREGWGDGVPYGKLSAPQRNELEGAVDVVAQAVRGEKAAKVIVVIDDDGIKRPYAVPTLGQTHDGSLVLGERLGDGSVLVSVTYPPSRWKRAYVDGTEVTSSAVSPGQQLAYDEDAEADEPDGDAPDYRGLLTEAVTELSSTSLPSQNKLAASLAERGHLDPL